MMARGSIPILRIGSNLLVSIQTDLHDAMAEAFQEDILVTIEKDSAAGLLIDVSGLETVDSYVARVLADTGKMARLMGTETVIVGIRAEVAATLVRMGYTMGNVVRTALNVDDGLKLLATTAGAKASATTKKD
jgi:rsbT antagonist protein RsbS